MARAVFVSRGRTVSARRIQRLDGTTSRKIETLPRVRFAHSATHVLRKLGCVRWAITRVEVDILGE